MLIVENTAKYKEEKKDDLEFYHAESMEMLVWGAAGASPLSFVRLGSELGQSPLNGYPRCPLSGGGQGAPNFPLTQNILAPDLPGSGLI